MLIKSDAEQLTRQINRECSNTYLQRDAVARIFTACRADSTLESAPDPAHLTPDSTKNGNIKPLLVGFGVAVAPVLGVLLLGHVVHEVDVGHYADDDLPRLHILL